MRSSEGTLWRRNRSPCKGVSSISASRRGRLRHSRALFKRATNWSCRHWLSFRSNQRPDDPNDVLWDYLSLSVVLLGTALVILTFHDYGITWDEPLHNWYGNFIIDNYQLFFRDNGSLRWDDMYFYGAAFDIAAATVNRVSFLGTYETRHLLNGLVGVLGLVGCCKLGRSIGGARAGFLATVFLLMTPNYYGQIFNNPKDIPFAAGMVWGTYYLVRLVPALPRPPLQLVAKLGAAIGLALGVRVGGLLLVCYLGVLLVVSAAWQAAAARRPWLLVEFGLTSLWWVLLPAVLVAYPIMLMCWPWAQTDPLVNPWGALAHFSHFYYSLSTLFAGRLVPASDVPWAYLPTYIAFNVTELVLRRGEPLAQAVSYRA